MSNKRVKCRIEERCMEHNLDFMSIEGRVKEVIQT